MQQIAVREMQLDGVEAEPHRALGGIGEGGAYARHILFGHGARRMPARSERQRRGRDRLPGILSRRQRLGAFPWTLRRSLASGMGELDGELCRSDVPAMRDDAIERLLAGIGIEPEAAVGDAAVALDMGRLDDQHAGAGIRQHAEMGHVPVVGDAVVGAVLAHRRNDDAVGNVEVGEPYGREQGTRHEGHLPPG